MYARACSSLFKQVHLVFFSLRGFDAFDGENNSSWELRMKIGTFFILLIGKNIESGTLPV